MRSLLTTVALLLAAGTAAAAEAPTVLATADGEGALTTCEDCPLKLGGIAKRATLLAREREAAGAALLVDAGNSLFGAETEASKGAVAAELFERLGYDVLNLGWRDFRFGLAATRAAVADRSFAVVSANLRDAESGERLFPASTVVERGGRRILVVGATRRPPEAGAFPWIDRQLAGVEVRAPAAEVKAALDAGPDTDSRILLWYGSPAALRLALGDLLPRFDAVVVGGARPSDLPAGVEPPMAATISRGRSVARVSLGKEPRVEEPRLVASEIEDDPAVAAVVERALAAEEPGPPPLPEGEIGEVPSDLGSVRDVHLHVRGEGEDRAFGVLVLGLDVDDTWNGVRAGRERRLIIADVSVENRIAPDVVIDGGLPEVMQVAETRRQFFLLVNGRRVVPVAPKSLGVEGALPSRFVLRPGDAADGKLVFAVPETGIRTLELRFYPEASLPSSSA